MNHSNITRYIHLNNAQFQVIRILSTHIALCDYSPHLLQEGQRFDLQPRLLGRDLAQETHGQSAAVSSTRRKESSKRDFFVE